MTPTFWVELAGLIITIVGAIITLTIVVRSFREELVQTTLAYERKLTQMDFGLRGQMADMGFYVRDNYVQNDVFNRMIDMAAASNENQFRALASSIERINEKLDTIQADYRRSQA